MLSKQDMDYQIERASTYLIKGGDFEKWIGSKQFSELDEARLRVFFGYASDKHFELVFELVEAMEGQSND